MNIINALYLKKKKIFVRVYYKDEFDKNKIWRQRN